ncbi:single-stranded-DNA-specific exonuclease RecJ [Paenibacillus thermotolerans]|uniref:single-stranded-DNA-specific exonuclease RecJ n=1 Tax=Paenibacillus thermotolerans TaxID=3027807 RepID=UPI002367A81F|nr:MULTISPECIES: single-stranded-DNA-specific exonuclease RecJ [unclassified Paenibacillus]
MLSSKMRWDVGAPDPDKVRALAQRLNAGPLLAALLAVRGIGPEEAEFFMSEEPAFHDPFLLDGMAPAVERIRRALDGGEYIRVYGDYDADGVSSTSLMVRLLRMLGARFDYYIPHRVTEGYGLHVHSVEKAHADGVKLLITVDTGISAAEQIHRANELGLETIVTDHHEPPERLPEALAVINPKKPGCTYPFKGLAGVGVAFKLAQALLGRVPEELAEYAALGTIADLMPLTGENRGLVKLGLSHLRKTGNLGFLALMRAAGIDRSALSAGQVAFALAPRVNAVGRLESADEAVRLLVTDDAAEAERCARRLDELNRERQELVESTAEEALRQVAMHDDIPDVIVVHSDEWNPGVIGIVASRIVERFFRPAVVIAVDPQTGIGKASARSVPGFHLYEAIRHCSDILEHFGGHEAAAGLSVREDRIAELAERLNRYAAVTLTPEMKVPSLKADAVIEGKDITVESIEELETLAPFGAGHPTPRFVIRGARASGAAAMGKDAQHLKLRLDHSQQEAEMEAIYFGAGGMAPLIGSGARVDLLGELSINEWKGRKKPQLIVRDLCIPHRQAFDWRHLSGRRAADDCWKQWGLEERKAVILVSEQEGVPAEFEARLSDVPVWMRTYEGEWRQINEEAGKTELSDITDAIIASYPFPLHSFRHILEQCPSLERLYAAFGGSPARRGSRADRAALGALYKVMKQQIHDSGPSLCSYVSKRSGAEPSMIRFAVQVFRELELLETGERGELRCPDTPRKRELHESPTYRMELAAAKARRIWDECPSETLYARLLESIDLDDGLQDQHKTEAIL